MAPAQHSHSQQPRSKRFRFKHPHQTPKPLTTKPTPPSSPPSPTKALDPDPEPTFAQSLFASLSSTSAAEFWADIYGQPIHIYPRPILSGRPLSDKEYVAYVQQRLWENTREGAEERARQRAQQRVVEQEQQREREAEEQRQRRKRKREEQEQEQDFLAAAKARDDAIWEERVGRYIAAWDGDGGEIPWPCVGEGGEMDVESVEEFLQRVAKGMGVGFEQVVKVERVRWHPDKILQRFGDGVGGEVGMERVNEVWRAVDAVWRRIKD